MKTGSIAALLLLGTVATAVAAASEPVSRDNDGTFSLLLENDAVAGTDRNYTNGFEMSYLSGASGPKSDEGLGRRLGFVLGHQIYTPNNTDAGAPVFGERPYAAWAYAGFALVYDSGSALDTWLLNIGVVGPDAAGEDIQNDLHRHIGSQRSNGWANQLRDEVAGQLVYDHRWRGIVTTKREGIGIDLTPHVGFSVGNIATYANAGATLRFGNDLRNDYGVPRIRPALPGSAFFAPRDSFGWYVFAGVDARAVAYNMFLDGTYFRESPVTVDRKPFVTDLQAGLALTLGRTRLSYTYVVRSKEFEGQPEVDRFGSVAVSVKF